MVYILLLVGIISGFFIGMIGTGAGVIMIPGMMYLGGLSFQEAVGITLLMQTLPVGITGAYQYWYKGLLPYFPALLIAIGMLLGITSGGYIAANSFINIHILKLIFAMVAILTGITVLYQLVYNL
jgi:uncharacterized membrane protein YfcA